MRVLFTIASWISVISAGQAQPTFETILPGVTVGYPPGASAVEFSAVARFEVSSGSPTVQGFSLGIRHSESLLEIEEVFLPADMMTINCGTTPDYWAVELFEDGFTTGTIFGFLASCAQIDMDPGESLEMVGVTYRTRPGVLSGSPEIDTQLEFSDTLGNPAVTTVIVADGSVYPPTHAPASVSIAPGVVEMFARGECSGDGAFDIADPISLLGSLLVPGAPAPPCLDACDSNDDGELDVSDPVHLLAALFIPGAPAVEAPAFPDCGIDETDDALGCERQVACP